MAKEYKKLVEELQTTLLELHNTTDKEKFIELSDKACDLQDKILLHNKEYFNSHFQ